MIWQLIFLGGLALILTGLARAIRSGLPDMLMLIGGVVAFVGWVGISAGMEQTGQTAQLAQYKSWLLPGAGALTLAWAAYQFRLNAGTLFWPSAPATILTSEVVGLQTAKQRYAVQVRYRYTVAGRAYESTRRVTDTEEPVDSSRANAIAARYAKGGEAAAYYNPQNPAEAYLERAVVNGRWLIPALLGAGLLWMGVTA